jgi:hypothetical protein
VDRTTSDGAVDDYGSPDLAVAGLASTSGAHWANRDEDMLYRRSSRPAPFRRPPAVNSFPAGDGDAALSPSGYLPPETDEAPEATEMAHAPDTTDSSWFGGDRGDGYAHHDTRDWTAADRAEPAFGPAPPATPGRASFGVTAGPISPSGRLGVAPTSPAHSRTQPPAAQPPAAQPPAQPGDWNTGDFGSGDHERADFEFGAGEFGAGEFGAGEFGAGEFGPDEFGTGEFGTGGHEIRPHRATRHEPAGHDQNPQRGDPRLAPPGGAPRRSRTVMAGVIGLAVLILLGGAAAGMMFYSGSEGDEAGGKTISAPLDGRKAASFELVAATTKVNVKTQDLGDRLYRITSADDTLPIAVLSDDRVQLHLTADDTNADGQVEVLLSTKVRWALRFVGGADQQVVDLTSGKVSGLQVLGGSRRLQLALPKPAGTVPISVTGSIEDFSITSPKESPVRVQVESGAKTVAAGNRTLRDVKPGSTLTPKGWNVPNRYDVDAAARVTLLSVDAR